MQITVLVNSYNHGKFIENAIKSILMQNFPREDYEIIVVDACSTDETVEVLEKYRDELKVVYQKDSRGLAAGCNMGIKASKGKYILRLDADDTFLQNIMLVESLFLDSNEDIDFVYPDYIINQANVTKKINLPSFNPEEIFIRGDFLGGGTMYRRVVFDKYGYYDESFKCIENYELIIRMLKKGVKGLHLSIPLYKYYIHDDSMSSNRKIMFEDGKKIEQLYDIKYQIGKYHPRNIRF